MIYLPFTKLSQITIFNAVDYVSLGAVLNVGIGDGWLTLSDPYYDPGTTFTSILCGIVAGDSRKPSPLIPIKVESYFTATGATTSDLLVTANAALGDGYLPISNIDANITTGVYGLLMAKFIQL